MSFPELKNSRPVSPTIGTGPLDNLGIGRPLSPPSPTIGVLNVVSDADAQPSRSVENLTGHVDSLPVTSLLPANSSPVTAASSSFKPHEDTPYRRNKIETSTTRSTNNESHEINQSAEVIPTNTGATEPQDPTITNNVENTYTESETKPTLTGSEQQQALNELGLDDETPQKVLEAAANFTEKVGNEELTSLLETAAKDEGVKSPVETGYSTPTSDTEKEDNSLLSRVQIWTAENPLLVGSAAAVVTAAIVSYNYEGNDDNFSWLSQKETSS